MAVEQNYTRLGAFLIVAGLVVAGTLGFFLQRLRDRPVVLATTFTAENITGLDVSSRVLFKGVPVGRVDQIRVDPVSKLVEVGFELYLDRLANLGADIEEVERRSDVGVLSEFRASVIGNPLTGEAHVLVDVPANPPPVTAQEVHPERLWVPSMPSPLAGVTGRLPELIQRGESLIQAVERLVVVAEPLVERLPESLDRADRFFANTDQLLAESELPALTAEARAFLSSSSEELARLSDGLTPLLGEDGELARFLEALGDSELPAASADMLAETSLAMHDLRRTLPAIRQGLEQIRALSRLLEEQPESILYGRRQ